MRLTLRTLLAYLDDVLEPAQAREIGEKIAQSDFASTLSNRIKDVLRRRRITAPDLDGPGMGVDPNTVAEYLDNTLSPDAVADVERIFLESDVHLAEVAASHQILTLVLGEPVTITDESRDRMYALGPDPKHDPELVAAMGGNGRQPTGGEEAKSQPAKSRSGSFDERLPAYLRRKPLWKRAFPWVVVLLLAGGFAFAIWNDPSFFGGTDDAGDGETVAQNNDDKDGPTGPADQKKPGNKPAEKKPGPQDDEIAKNDPMKKGVLPKVPEGVNGKPPADVPENGQPKKNQKSIVGTKPPVDGMGDAKDAKKKKTTVAKKPVDAGKAKPKVAVGPAPKMQYVSPGRDGLMWRYNAGEKDWQRMKHLDEVKPGDRLATPAPFSSTLSIGDGRIRAQLRRGTQVEIRPADESARFGFDVKRGRLVVAPAGAAKDDKAARPVISLGIHGRKYRVELLTEETTLGVEVQPAYPNKFEATSDQPYYSAALLVSKGSVRLSNEQQDVVVVSATADTAGKANLTPPADKGKDAKVNMVTDQIAGGRVWVNAPPTQSESEGEYSEFFLKDLDAGMKGRVSLLDNVPAIVRDRRAYVSQYAVESLAVVENVESLVHALSIADHEESRDTAIDGLRSWLAFHPGQGKTLQADLRMRFTEDDSVAIYRLLWGFNEKDARDYATSVQLIRWMNHDHIAVRELAFRHVYRLTKFQYNYQPNLRPDLRALSFKRWGMHLDKNGALLPPEKKPAAKKQP